MILTRRTALLGLGSLLSVPAVVRASSLMPVRAIKPPFWSNGTYEGIWFIDLSDDRLMGPIELTVSDATGFTVGDVVTIMQWAKEVRPLADFVSIPAHPKSWVATHIWPHDAPR